MSTLHATRYTLLQIFNNTHWLKLLVVGCCFFFFKYSYYMMRPQKNPPSVIAEAESSRAGPINIVRELKSVDRDQSTAIGPGGNSFMLCCYVISAHARFFISDSLFTWCHFSVALQSFPYIEIDPTHNLNAKKEKKEGKKRVGGENKQSQYKKKLNCAEAVC